jgi:hypothetical protein
MPDYHFPRNPHTLESYELREIVEAIQELLWLDGEVWNADKKCASTDVRYKIAALLADYHLKPKPKE